MTIITVKTGICVQMSVYGWYCIWSDTFPGFFKSFESMVDNAPVVGSAEVEPVSGFVVYPVKKQGVIQLFPQVKVTLHKIAVGKDLFLFSDAYVEHSACPGSQYFYSV